MPPLQDVRFCKVTGDESPDTVQLCRYRLKVDKSPYFILFRGTNIVQRWSGSDEKQLREELRAAETTSKPA